MHTIEIPENQAEEIAEEIRKSLETEHISWFADFQNDLIHYVIFPEKIFKLDKNNPEDYKEAKNYGISIGIPEYQLAFSPEID